ncbi:hypothetical protein BGW36DRAFT_149806 [Talaromyces proteolyticus]|uniref:Transcription factor domain-containing protein n=1 Tax=Talaromyces proteolyticus TaxID=1131652 RepID=A0AAD4KY66_9EURO|nr:uncharacterized protein BGW36DRAFT_149806 [Talaromyces proteolyticus]KAH8698691.1 hypothetical protein BGW36DRAFT_149806 [Talaromyces proteolyticus]
MRRAYWNWRNSREEFIIKSQGINYTKHASCIDLILKFSASMALSYETASPNEVQNIHKEKGHRNGVSPGQTIVSHSPGFSMDGIDLGPPIATLRSLGALSKDEPNSNSNLQTARTKQAPYNSIYDPVSRGVLTIHEAQRAISIFFDNCHLMAPVLNESLRASWHGLRLSAPMLFLAIISVGTRFWNAGYEEYRAGHSVHPRFSELTSLLDQAVSRLLLRPNPSDVTLNSIRMLLLYAQWMPCNSDDEDDPSPKTTAAMPKGLKSRYNEISAWAVLGLALRYALFLGLDKSAVAPFQGPVKPVSDEDISCLRVWYNLLTCDFNLMLTSGLPASLDPSLSAQVARRFSSSRHTQQPGDLRVAGLVELVAVVHRAMRSCGDVSGRQLDSYCLRKLNTELEDWERTWLVRLRHTESQHNQLPFNSVRWYRLSLNSARLGPLLSSICQSSQQPLQVSLLHSFEISLTSAAQILISLSIDGAESVWRIESQNRATFPEGPFQVDRAAVGRLHYAVDSAWISHTFAVTFLVLCYIRGAVDENLQIRSLNPNSPINSTLIPPHSSSIIARLLRLALEIFDGVCPTATFHPARDFQAIVHDATSLVLAPANFDILEGQEPDELALQSLLDLMNDAGLEWPGNILETSGDFTSGFEPGAMF